MPPSAQCRVMPDAWRVPFSHYLAQQGVPSDLRRAYAYEVAIEASGEGTRYWNLFQRQQVWQTVSSDLVRKLRLKHLSYSTEKSYLGWVERFRTIQELLGHTDVKTTMIYTHVATRNRLGVRSPLDAATDTRPNF